MSRFPYMPQPPRPGQMYRRRPFQRQPAPAPQPTYDYEDRSALERQKYEQQAALIAQRRAQQQAQIQPLSQAERLHLMKLQGGLMEIEKQRQQGSITDDVANALRIQIHSGLNPLLARQQLANAQMAEQKFLAYQDQRQLMHLANQNYGTLPVFHPDTGEFIGMQSFDPQTGRAQFHAYKAATEKQQKPLSFKEQQPNEAFIDDQAARRAEDKMQRDRPWFDFKTIQTRALDKTNVDQGARDLLQEFVREKQAIKDQMRAAWQKHIDAEMLKRQPQQPTTPEGQMDMQPPPDQGQAPPQQPAAPPAQPPAVNPTALRNFHGIVQQMPKMKGGALDLANADPEHMKALRILLADPQSLGMDPQKAEDMNSRLWHYLWGGGRPEEETAEPPPPPPPGPSPSAQGFKSLLPQGNTIVPGF